jgi:hypothetical protein
VRSAAVAEADIVSGLKTKFGMTDADVAANSSLVSSCVKAYSKPVPGGLELTSAEIETMVPQLEAFYRPGQVLARSTPYVMPQEKQSFGEFAEQELFSPHFKFFVVGWGMSLALVTVIGLQVTPEIAEESAFMKSIYMRDGVLLKEDRDRLAKMGKL